MVWWGEKEECQCVVIHSMPMWSVCGLLLLSGWKEGWFGGKWLRGKRRKSGKPKTQIQLQLCKKPDPGTRAHIFPVAIGSGYLNADTRRRVSFEFEVPVKIPSCGDSNLRPGNSKHTHFRICHEALLNIIMC